MGLVLFLVCRVVQFTSVGAIAAPFLRSLKQLSSISDLSTLRELSENLKISLGVFIYLQPNEKNRKGMGGENRDNELWEPHLAGKGEARQWSPGGYHRPFPARPRSSPISLFLGIALGPSRVCYCPLMRETKTAGFFLSFSFCEKLKDSLSLQLGPEGCWDSRVGRWHQLKIHIIWANPCKDTQRQRFET